MTRPPPPAPSLCFYVGTFQIVAVKTEPKLEPTDAQYSLADLDGITDLLPIQTGQFCPLSPSQQTDCSQF